MKATSSANIRDPYFQDVPWEIFYDDAGKQVGELFIYSEPTPDRKPCKIKRRRKKK